MNEARRGWNGAKQSAHVMDGRGASVFPSPIISHHALSHDTLCDITRLRTRGSACYDVCMWATGYSQSHCQLESEATHLALRFASRRRLTSILLQ